MLIAFKPDEQLIKCQCSDFELVYINSQFHFKLNFYVKNKMNNAFSSCALLVVCCILNVSLYATCWPFMYACGLFCSFITVEC